jgi:hypothetical protein
VKRFSSALASALVGVVVGALVVMGADSLTAPDRPGPVRSPSRPVTVIPGKKLIPAGTILLAWAPGSLPARSEAVLEDLPGVVNATTVLAGLDWIKASYSHDGALIDSSEDGRMIPIEVAVIEPRDYGSFVAPADRAALYSLRPGNMLLAQTSALLRGGGEGMRLKLLGRTATVSGVVSDQTAQGYEAIQRRPVPRWSRADRFVLVHLRRASARPSVERAVRSLLAPGQVARVRALGETPFLRYGDAVLPQMLIKKTFGEFSATPEPDGSLAIEPRWVARNIRAVDVPLLGKVRCHRTLIPQLRAALRDVIDSGLSHTIDPENYGGCYTPRFIDRDPGGRLSHHSWGIGIDLNVSSNAFGTNPDQDRSLVEHMERWGFTWGGRWLIPDGMHFEWARFP